MRILKISLAMLLVCGCFLLTACGYGNGLGIDEETLVLDQLEPVKDGCEIAIIETTLGTIEMMLFPEEAPNTVAHFKKLVEEGFYDNKPLFVEGDMHIAITGATDDAGMEGKLVTEDGKPITCEIAPNLWHFSGAVSVIGWEENDMDKKLSSDSRFMFIGTAGTDEATMQKMKDYRYPRKVMQAYQEVGGYMQFTGAYTVFGHVYSGIEVVNALSECEADEESGMAKNDVKIISIRLSTYKTK